MDFSLGFNLSQTNLLSAVLVPVNQQPTAHSDSATTAYQTPVEIDLITNDIDLDGSIDASSVEITTQPVNGVVTINAQNGVATYTPNDGFSGTDSFEYRVSDMEGAWSEPVAVNLLVEPLRRNFTYLEESGGMYYQLSEELLFTDFEWDFDIMPEGDGDFHQLIAGYGCTLNLRAADDLIFYIDGATNTTTTEKLQRGKFNRVGVKRVSSELTLTVNGVGVTTTQDIAPFSVTRVGIREDYGTTSSFTGIFANLKMWNGGDRTTGTLVVDAPMDQDTGGFTYAENLQATYGSTNLWDKDSIYVSEGCSFDPETNEGRIYSTGPYASLRSYGPTSGKWYKIDFELYDLVAGSLVIKIGTDVYGKSFDKEGIYSVIVQAEPNASDSIEFKRFSIAQLNDFKIRNMSCVEVAGVSLDNINIGEDESSLYMLDGITSPAIWLGQDDIFHENFGSSGVNKWVDNGDGSFTKLNASGYGQLYLGTLPLGNYSTEVTVDQVDNAVGIYIKDVSNNLRLVNSYNSPGTYQEEVTTVSVSGNDIWFDSAPNAEATISGIKVTQNFEVV